MIPTVFHVPPAYFSKSQGDKPLLQGQAWACADAARAGDLNTAANIMSAWTQCRDFANYESKLVMTYVGQIFLDTYLKYRMEDYRFENWVADVYLKAASATYDRSNNHGAWGLLGYSLVSKILGQSLEPHVYRYYEYMAQATDDDGVLRHEVKRKESGMWYSYFALAPLLKAAAVLDTNHWMLYDSLDWLWQYVQHPESWPYKSRGGILGIVSKLLNPRSDTVELPRSNDWTGSLYFVAGRLFGRKDWVDYASPPPYPGVNLFRDGNF